MLMAMVVVKVHIFLLYVHLMKGENDDILTWPFKCDITVRLLNWREDKGHVEKTFDFTDTTDIKYLRE